MNDSLAKAVRLRSGNICEYCRMPQASSPGSSFHIDHIIARQHGGLTRLSNLAYCCYRRNAYKGPNLSGIDPVTKKLTKLFNPRRHKWIKHFRWDGPKLIGQTAVGRVTIMVLAINHPTRIRARQELMEEGLFSL